ncbi:LEC14B homolog isoform X1 [Malus sylvestris]|uniref:LEC14B homolog isoform X1 n=1 Tax=Malus sylvestris TaxID=3752 RepID=UPI0021AD465C|nr:LEC14B homolog isoform X1 [Malus sylvestris]
MSYRARFGNDNSACDSGNSAEGSGSSKGPDEVSNDFDHEIAQLTKHRSRPHRLLSGDMAGKSRLPVSTMKMLAGRESNYSGRGRFSLADCCHVLSRYLPINGPWGVDQSRSPAYVSQFSNDGLAFVAGFQGGHIRIYNVEKGWKVQKDILTKTLRWTITDTSLSPDQRYLVYASMTPVVNIVNVGSSTTVSVANVMEVHEGLDFSIEGDEDEFGIFSVKFSTDGRELVAASSDASIYVYDLQANKVSLRIPAHQSDVNTVCFADETGHLIYSGSDDNLCKVWDRRCLMTYGQASGVLMGHLEGVTFIDSRGDGRYLISNGKDQTTKLWDIRKMSSRAMYSPRLTDRDWDYRWMEYPAHARTLKHPNDQSLATYRGHAVLRTLIRCYFSPAYSTGQKYIYTGSSDHSVYIYDLVTGAQVAKLDHHEGPVRDCSWHPLYPILVSSSWDGTVARWEFPGDDQVPTLVRPKIRRRRGFY